MLFVRSFWSSQNQNSGCKDTLISTISPGTLKTDGLQQNNKHSNRKKRSARKPVVQLFLSLTPSLLSLPFLHKCSGLWKSTQNVHVLHMMWIYHFCSKLKLRKWQKNKPINVIHIIFHMNQHWELVWRYVQSLTFEHKHKSRFLGIKDPAIIFLLIQSEFK